MTDAQFEELTRGVVIPIRKPFNATSLSDAEIRLELAFLDGTLRARGELESIKTETGREMHAKKGALLMEKHSREANQSKADDDE